MTEDSSSSLSITPSAVVAELTHVREAARSFASVNLRLAAEAQRAIEVVEWSSTTGGVSSYPAYLKRELEQANRVIVGDIFRISSAESTVQMIVSSSVSLTVASALRTGQAPNTLAPALYHDATQHDLDDLLRWVTGRDELSERRREAWMTLERGTPESAAQACHSMRELLTHLLDTFSQNIEVKKAGWWQHDAQTRDGVSKRHKVKYLMICQSEAIVSEDLTKDLEAQIDRALELHNQAIKLAHHNQSASYGTARLVLTSFEEVTRTLLSYRRSLGGCR